MIIIREAAVQDADDIADISTNSLGYSCSAALVAKRLQEINPNKQKVFVAVDDNRAVGFVHAELYQLLYQEDKINILGLAVSKDFQRKGCGKKLVQSVELWAKEMKCTIVRLNSEVSRTEAHRFYENLGYKNTKSQKRFVKDLR